MGDVVRVGLLGCSNVGAAVARMLHDNAAEIERRAGARLEVTRVAVRNVSKERDAPLAPELFTHDAHEVVRDPNVDVVVEAIGGIEPARSLILESFSLGKSVVTANKELLSTLGRELFEAAAQSGVDLLFEASVGGGIPLIRPFRESLAGERVVRFMGILNGTTNYILTRMTEDGSALRDAVAEAQQLGYAERDPTADVEGYDAAAKAAILATIAFDVPFVAGDVYREGILDVSAEDIARARQLGYVVKLLAIAEGDEDQVSVRVHPAMIPADHPLASVRDSFNAVFVEGSKVGQLMFYGRGAGGDPSATSVVGDLIEIVRNRRHGAHSPAVIEHSGRRVRAIDEMSSQYYVLLHVDDRAGVLAAIARVFGEHDVSIKSVIQEGQGDEAQLVLITHRASERDFQACANELRHLDVVKSVSSILRVEGGER